MTTNAEQEKGSQQTEMKYNRKKRAPQDANESMTLSSLSKPSLKLELENRQTKITKFMNNDSNSRQSHFDRSHPKLKKLDKSHSKGEDTIKILELEEQSKKKDETIVELKNELRDVQERANKDRFNSRISIQKYKKLTADSMKEIAETKRKERAKIDERLGKYNGSFFVEGEYTKSLKNQIKAKDQLVKKYEEQKKKKKALPDELLRLSCAIDFLSREMFTLKKELQYRQKEVTSYKERMKLCLKQSESNFAKEGWPIKYDKYQTLELLGKGGFAEVYKVFDIEDLRVKALKISDFKKKNTQQHIKQMQKHLIREAEIQTSLDHPNIVKFYRFLKEEMKYGIAVFEIEYCTGPELSVYLRRHKCIEEKQARLIVKQLFSALQYLYNFKQDEKEKKVIHYDLKPGNIMFHEGQIKIGDFGLCKIMEDGEQSNMHLTSQGVGTYYYLPPETFNQCEPRISSKVDVWSVGVIFYEMLYGKKPYGDGMQQDVIWRKGIIENAKMVQFPEQTPKNYKVSEKAKQFIRDCMKIDPDKRLNPVEAYEHTYLRK